MNARIAVVIVRPHGVSMGTALAQALGGTLFVPAGSSGALGTIYRDGPADLLRQQFHAYRGWVLIMASGIATRSLQGLACDKRSDPAVVVCDEFGRFAVTLLSGHEGGANALAYAVSAVTGAVPVVTTATEAMKPYVLGIGCRLGATAQTIERAVAQVLSTAHVTLDQIREVATIRLKCHEPGLREFCRRHAFPLRAFEEAELKAHGHFPSRSAFVESVTGVPGVCEPAALYAAHRGVLIQPKMAMEGVTVALVREQGFAPMERERVQPEQAPASPLPAERGRLYLVSIGPGDRGLLPPMASEAIARSDVVVGYRLYLDLISELLAGKEVIESSLGNEHARAALAIHKAAEGDVVSLVSSGDIGVYGMASIVYTLLHEQRLAIDVETIPGISAAHAAAARLGAPLARDFAVISLSDLHYPWETILQKVRQAAWGDFVIVFYNVQSARRQTHIYEALRAVIAVRHPDTPCGIARNAYRDDQEIRISTLAQLMHAQFDMLTTVIIGNQATRVLDGRLVTLPHADEPAGSAVPQSVWVFAGTADGNQLARRIHQAGHPVTVFTASDYGARVATTSLPKSITVHAGRLGRAQLETLMTARHPRAIVDATHPYATRISQHLQALCSIHAVPYLRWERPSEPVEYDRLEWVDSLEAAAHRAAQLGTRLFLTTGSTGLEAFLNATDCSGLQLFVRMIPDPERIRMVIMLGVPPSHIFAMQGPFSEEVNRSQWRSVNVDCVITKDSGIVGGFRDKVNAARSLGIPILVVRRPRTGGDPHTVFQDVEPLLEHLQTLELPRDVLMTDVTA